MTLIIAADVQDHLILAGDHCAVLSRVSNGAEPDVVLRNYQKVYPWKYGAIAASGDVFLAVNFRRLFMLHESLGQPVNLAQVARDAKAVRARNGAMPNESVGNIFLTLPGHDGFELHGVFVGENSIEIEVIAPTSTRFSVREDRAPDESACHAFNSKLRPSFFFEDIDAFHRRHLDLLSTFFAEQSATDELVTSSFDVFMLDKRSGVGRFWRTPDAVKTLVSLRIDDGMGDDGSAADCIHMTEAEGRINQLALKRLQNP